MDKLSAIVGILRIFQQKWLTEYNGFIARPSGIPGNSKLGVVAGNWYEYLENRDPQTPLKRQQEIAHGGN